MRRDCAECDEEIDHEEFTYCPYCGESTREVEYIVIRRYNRVGSAVSQTYGERDDAVEYAREMVDPENNPDHYDWTVDEDPDGEVVFYAEEGELGGLDMPSESVTVRKSLTYR